MNEKDYRGGSTTPGAAGMNGAGEPNVPQYPGGQAPARCVVLSMVGDMLTQQEKLIADLEALRKQERVLLKQIESTKEAATASLDRALAAGTIAENVSYPIVIDGQCRLLTIAAGMTARGERKEWLVSRPA